MMGCPSATPGEANPASTGHSRPESLHGCCPDSPPCVAAQTPGARRLKRPGGRRRTMARADSMEVRTDQPLETPDAKENRMAQHGKGHWVVWGAVGMLVAGLAAAAPAWAQQPAGPPSPPERHGSLLTPEDRAAMGQIFWHRMQEKLGLSDTQVKGIRDLLEAQRTARRAEVQQLMAARRELRGADGAGLGRPGGGSSRRRPRSPTCRPSSSAPGCRPSSTCAPSSPRSSGSSGKPSGRAWGTGGGGAGRGSDRACSRVRGGCRHVEGAAQEGSGPFGC